jgi:hypothetical protein
MKLRSGIPLLLCLLPGLAGAQDVVVHHHVELTLQPGEGTLQVTDRLRLPQAVTAAGRVVVALNAGFALREVSGARVERRGRGERLQELVLHLAPGGGGAVTLAFGGRPVLSHRGEGVGEWLDAGGAHLGAASAWYPRGEGQLHTFDLGVRLPPGWRAIAPGRPGAASGEGVARWRSERPVDDIDLVAGPFLSFRREAPWGTAAVWLREDDPALAATYLDATTRYLPFYAALIGPYPYSRFTVVENLRQSGWGMPSFTLLGSRVMRLPFIPHTSLPHEVLHNWWGNGVLVDYHEGNWSEGLTAYLADHLIAERRGKGVRHRRDALARFRSAAGEGIDTAPVLFLSRHDRRSQSVGYDKPLMIFHMARRARGDAAFVQALRGLYREGLGRRVGAREVLARLAPGEEDWFSAWWTRPGAPRLALACCTLAERAGGYRVSGRLRQVQDRAPVALRAPVQVLVAGEGVAREHVVAMQAATADFSIDLPARPLALQVDAAFDLMRLPEEGELPPALGELLGAEDPVAVVSGDAGDALAAAYHRLAAGVGARVVAADAAASAAAVWVLGAGAALAAPWREAIAQRVPQGDSRVMVARDGGGRVLAIVDAGSARAAEALAGKLRHYGRYGLLGFSGDAARNVFKGEVAPTGSALRVTFDDAWRGRALPLAERPALAP